MKPVDDPITRPKAIDSAFQAVLASVAISAVATVVTVMLDTAQLTSMITPALESLPPDQRLSTSAMIAAFRVILGFSIVVFAGLFVLFAVKMRAGRNWARILLTIYTAFGAFGFLTSMASAGPDLELMWSLAEVAFGVTAVVYMFRPESTKYFTEHRERRMRARQGPWEGR
jgi:hypothetical protein